MEICFIPGYACRASIFDAVLKKLPSSFAIEWPLDELLEMDDHEVFCDWLCSRYERELSDCRALVGHSLGGGIAFYLSMRRQFKNVQVILVDYFLNTPPPFFRNYCCEHTPVGIHEDICQMMAKTKPYFNPAVLSSFEDYRPQLLARREQLNGLKLCAIYGMRSEGNWQRVEEALELSPEMKDYLDLHFIENAAHFPTVEQPEAFAELLTGLLNNS